MIEVIHISAAPRGWEQQPQYVYIGRTGRGHDGYFGNPIRLNQESERDAVLREYESYFAHRLLNDSDFVRRVALIPTNARLVCFCAPKACHGDVIARFANALNTATQQ